MRPSPLSYKQRLPVWLCLLLLVWCLGMGWGVSNVMAASQQPGTVDPVFTDQLELGQEYYLENCTTCHIALPPAVFPSETWRQLLMTTEHYGVEIKLPFDPQRVLMWLYLQTFSRAHLEKEEIPFRLPQSRYFKALHPRVTLPQPVNIRSCITCHPGAEQYNFRELNPDVSNSP
jgi:hypothetical protein